MNDALPASSPDRSPPHSAEAEEHVIACCLLDGNETIDRCLEQRLAPESFYFPANRLLFEIILELKSAGKAVMLETLAEQLKTRRQLEAVGGFAYLIQVTGKIPTTAHAGYFIEKVREQHLLRELIKDATGAVESAYAYSGGGFDELAGVFAAAAERLRNPQSMDRARSRKFTATSCPPEPVPRFLINGRGVCTPGNLTNLIAQSKAGKSAFTGAMIAAVECAARQVSDYDTLGVTATAPGERKVLHIDTEQSLWDHHQLVRRALRRAGNEDADPVWLWSYGLAGTSANELRTTIRALFAEAARKGGVFAAIVDGVADLVNDVNDAEECNAFVAELHALAIKYDCAIINVIHENPGQDGGKGRGHLGSQLERKAESNLRLKKTDEVTVVFSEKMRKAPILEKDGPRFRWDDQPGMHVTVATAGATRETKRAEELRDLAADVFEGRPSMRYIDLVEVIKTTRKCSERTAERTFGDFKKHAIIEKFPPNLWALKA